MCICKSFLKDCLRYIFASLFLSLNESICHTRKNVFLIYFKRYFPAEENQILVFQISKFHDAIQCLRIKQEIHFTE